MNEQMNDMKRHAMERNARMHGMTEWNGGMNL